MNKHHEILILAETLARKKAASSHVVNILLFLFYVDRRMQKGRKVAYKKVYPSKLKFVLKGNTLFVHSAGGKQYKPDIWGIKYLFDNYKGSEPIKVWINDKISKIMALRMYFLRDLFPNIEFHDADGDKYIAEAEEIIGNIAGKKYITYNSVKHPLDNRDTKNKPESLIEKELADNLSLYISDFPAEAKVIRQFPANIFEGSIKKEFRITKLWIDMVSVNSAGELSPIELKVGGNIPLDLFAQGLDYGIYCHLFKEHIGNNWFKGHSSIARNKITIYYIGEKFHPALVGREEEKGLIFLIKKGSSFNIVFIEIKVDKNRRMVKGSKAIFDSRDQ